MVMSLFCIGYSAWAITPEGNPEAYPTGTITSYTVSDLSMSRHGLSLQVDNAVRDSEGAVTTEATYTAKKFSYSTITANGTSTNQYTNTTLSMLLKVEHAKLTSYSDYADKNLVVTCIINAQATDSDNTSENLTISGFTTDTFFKDQFETITAGTLSLVGYPNLSVPITVVAGDTLNITIPLEYVYNLITLDKINASTGVSYLALELDFTQKDTLTNEYIPIFCGGSYSFVYGEATYAGTATATYTFTARLEMKP